MDKKVIVTEWENCYPSNWKGVITPEAMAHPAKYSSKLIRRIYEHMIEMDWLRAGDKVVDPFGGDALGALDAMRLGLHWYGVELEAKFAGLGTVNILEWNNRFGNMPRWGSAHLFNGDSRKLIEVVQGKVSAAVSSPPFVDQFASQNNFVAPHDSTRRMDTGRQAYGTTPGQLSAMPAGNFKAALSSPQFLQSEGGAHVPSHYAEDPTFMKRHAAGNKSSNAYGESDGQLSSMKDGGFDAAVSSPPYNPPMSQDHNGKRGGKRGTTPSEPGAFVKYGNTEGQLEGMNMEGFDAAISSPPFGKGSEGVLRADKFKDPEAFARMQMTKGNGASFEAKMRAMQKDNERAEYGETEGQLGSMSTNNFDASISSPPYDETRVGKESGQEHCGNGDQYGETDGQLGGADDFWLAARAIVEQVYQALEPGGHAVWVVKDYVKAKKIVPFCDQWRQLCEAVGFVTEHEHHAMLVHHKGTQHTLDGGQVECKTESKSFFRRLAEKKGSPRIDWETVFCMTKL
jgi:hypothetical protein